MTTDVETIDVRGRLQLPANVSFPEEDKEVHTIILVDSTELRLSLVNFDTTEEWRRSLLNTLRENETKYKTAIREIEQTLVVPQVEIVLKGRTFDKSELIVGESKILLHRGQLINSNWYKVSQEIITVYNALIDELFKIYPHQAWVRKELTRLTTRFSGDSVNFPWCLNSWNIEFGKISSEEWIGGFSFGIAGDAVSQLDLQIAEASISHDKLENVRRSLTVLLDSKAGLPVPWEYLYYAFRHLDEGNVRNAVIDLDIAIDFIVRKYLAKEMLLNKRHVSKILDKSSTGDLLLVAQAMAKKDSEFTTWGTLNELHTLRGTILHKYQRRFSREHSALVEKAKAAIISLLEYSTPI